MNKQYFEDEEEAYELYDKTFPVGWVQSGKPGVIGQCVRNAKENGYIKQSELEKAEKLNDKIMGKAMGDYDIGDINTMINYNIELKKEIERLKK